MTIQRTNSAITLQFSSTTVQLKPTGFLIGDYEISMPGEYDLGSVGFDVGEGYGVLHGDGLHVLVVEPTHPRLSADTITALEDISLVVTPSDADAERRRSIASLLNNLEPRGVVVIGTAEDAKNLTGTAVEPQAKLKIQATDLVGDELRVWTIA